MARMILWTLITGLLALPGAALATDRVAATDEIAFRRDDDGAEVVALDDDDDGDDTNSNSASSGVDSNDRTGSGYSAVSRDRDLSRGDRTRDRTRDGAGGPKRDWTGGHTNDRSRNDSR